MFRFPLSVWKLTPHTSHLTPHKRKSRHNNCWLLFCLLILVGVFAHHTSEWHFAINTTKSVSQPAVILNQSLSLNSSQPNPLQSDPHKQERKECRNAPKSWKTSGLPCATFVASPLPLPPPPLSKFPSLITSEKHTKAATLQRLRGLRKWWLPMRKMFPVYRSSIIWEDWIRERRWHRGMSWLCVQSQITTDIISYCITVVTITLSSALWSSSQWTSLSLY